MRVNISGVAETQIVEAGRYYETQSADLGVSFIDKAYGEIDRLEFNGGIHAKRHGFHCVVIHPFPYAIYYLVLDQVVNVRAFLDCRRNPAWIRTRPRNLQ